MLVFSACGGQGVQVCHIVRCPARFDNAHVLALQASRLSDTAAVRDHTDAVAHGFCVGRNALAFFFGDETALQFLVVGSDTGGAGVLVALKGLDATQGEHEAAG